MSPEASGRLAGAAQRSGLDVVGVFTHGGHSYGLGGAAERAARQEVEALTVAVAALRADGIEARVVSAGSTPTALLSSVGSVVAVVPNHVCPVVNLARELMVVRGGAVMGRWEVAARSVV